MCLSKEQSHTYEADYEPRQWLLSPRGKLWLRRQLLFRPNQRCYLATGMKRRHQQEWKEKSRRQYLLHADCPRYPGSKAQSYYRYKKGLNYLRECLFPAGSQHFQFVQEMQRW